MVMSIQDRISGNLGSNYAHFLFSLIVRFLSANRLTKIPRRAFFYQNNIM